MWSTIEQMFVMIAITVLKGTIKNPGAVKSEGTIVAALAQAATEADLAINGTVWTSASGTPAPLP
jgi:hypothetical protein